jgi:hypothetical protein
VTCGATNAMSVGMPFISLLGVWVPIDSMDKSNRVLVSVQSSTIVHDEDIGFRLRVLI